VIWIELVGFAALIAGVVRVALIVWPPASAKLPDPAKLGMPVAGPASVKSAHAALSRRGSGRRPKFRT
jgi:hypothetical protein